MTRYHINTNGDPGLCKAAHQCPFGGDSEHFPSMQEARTAFEHSQNANVFKKIRSRTFIKKAVTIGAMTMVTVSLAACSSISNTEGIGPYTSPANPAPIAEEMAPSENSEPSVDWQAIKDRASELKEQGQDWLETNAPSIREETERLLEEYGSPGGDESQQVAIDGVYWQGGSLTPTASEVADAQTTLDSLVVKPESGEGYNRQEHFGRGFQTGMAGAIEHRDVPTAVFKNASPQARVVDGRFMDPYTGLEVHVIGGKSDDADIDHIVPLKEAYESGADSWSKDERVAFANDMSNLVYTASSVNRSKGHQDAATWIPSYQPAQCTYVISQITVKGKYNLSIDSAEKAALQQVLDSRCN